MKLAPIAVFTYNRPFHTQKVLHALSQCRCLERCTVHILCDGPKDPTQSENVKKVQEVIQEWAPRLQAHVVIREKNLGLAHSIVQGVSELCHQYGRVIVLEDDFIPSVDFIDYMIQALDLYQDAPEVYQISGYMFPIDVPQKPDTLFLPLTTTRGWATWDRAWREFDWNTPGYKELFESSEMRKKFDLDNSYPYYQMLISRFEGKNDSWGILWWYTVFKANGLVLYPSKSLVWIGGFDGTGTHCGKQILDQAPIEEFSLPRLSESIKYPSHIISDEVTFNKIKMYLKAQNKKLEINLFSALPRICRIFWRIIYKKHRDVSYNWRDQHD